MTQSLLVRESEVSEQPDVCGASIDLINPETSRACNLSVATIYIDPGKSSTPHFHKVMEEVYYFIAGVGRLTIGSEIFEVTPGSAAFIPIGKVHALANTSNERLKFLVADSPSYDPTDIYYSAGSELD